VKNRLRALPPPENRKKW
jgi:hypothetical protein